jgi:hypothetical protein
MSGAQDAGGELGALLARAGGAGEGAQVHALELVAQVAPGLLGLVLGDPDQEARSSVITPEARRSTRLITCAYWRGSEPLVHGARSARRSLEPAERSRRIGRVREGVAISATAIRSSRAGQSLSRGRVASDAVGGSDRRHFVQEPLIERRVDGIRRGGVHVVGEVTLAPAPEFAVETVKPAFDGQHQPGLVPSLLLEVLAIDGPHHPAAQAGSASEG